MPDLSGALWIIGFVLVLLVALYIQQRGER